PGRWRVRAYPGTIARPASTGGPAAARDDSWCDYRSWVPSGRGRLGPGTFGAGAGAEAACNGRRDALRVQPALGEQERRIAMIHEAIGEPQHEQRDLDTGGRERFADRASGAAGDHVLLDAHERVVLSRER